MGYTDINQALLNGRPNAQPGGMREVKINRKGTIGITWRAGENSKGREESARTRNTVPKGQGRPQSQAEGSGAEAGRRQEENGWKHTGMWLYPLFLVFTW